MFSEILLSSLAQSPRLISKILTKVRQRFFSGILASIQIVSISSHGSINQRERRQDHFKSNEKKHSLSYFYSAFCTRHSLNQRGTTFAMVFKSFSAHNPVSKAKPTIDLES